MWYSCTSHVLGMFTSYENEQPFVAETYWLSLPNQASEREEGELSPAPEAKPAETPQQAKRRAKLEEAKRAEVVFATLLFHFVLAEPRHASTPRLS